MRRAPVRYRGLYLVNLLVRTRRSFRKMSFVLPPPLAFRSRAAVASSLAAHPLPLVEAADRLRAPRSAERCVGFRPQDTARCRSLAWGSRARFSFARGGRRLPCCSPAPARRSLPVGLEG